VRNFLKARGSLPGHTARIVAGKAAQPCLSQAALQNSERGKAVKTSDDERKALDVRGGTGGADGEGVQTAAARAASGNSPSVGRAPQTAGESPLNRLLTNELLAALPADEFARLLPRFEPVTLRVGEDLYKMDAGVRAAYFPETAVVSHLYVLADGNSTEAAMIGREGLLGLSAVFEASQPGYWARVLVAGSALRIDSETLKQEFRRGGALQQLLLSYAGARMAQLSQRAVCNGRHTVDERLCCWLLMVHDRTGGGRLQLTHEQIAAHLGTRRAGVTNAAAALRDAGIISYNRGDLNIDDREALESSACECYRVLRHTVGRAALNP
jgi:CRP-like cAMP-binding protein